MPTESDRWKIHLPEARSFCAPLQRTGMRPCDALVEFGVQPFGDETWPEAQRLMAKAIAQRNHGTLVLEKILEDIFYGSSSLSQ
jgi:hypothetical protein